MEFISTSFDGLWLIKAPVYKDNRGLFGESFQVEKMRNYIPVDCFVQDNMSLSGKHVLRGLHFQKEPYAQGKLIRVLQGSCLDVAVDLRPKSSTYLKHFKYLLTDQDFHMLYIPEGFAHGFLSLQDDTIFTYKCTNLYQKDLEDCLRWDDPELGIDWGVDHPLVSEKDQQGKCLKDIIHSL